MRISLLILILFVFECHGFNPSMVQVSNSFYQGINQYKVITNGYSGEVELNAIQLDTDIFIGGNLNMTGGADAIFADIYCGIIYGNGNGITNIQSSSIVGGITTNLPVLIIGNRTNILCFTNGILGRVISQ